MGPGRCPKASCRPWLRPDWIWACGASWRVHSSPILFQQGTLFSPQIMQKNKTKNCIPRLSSAVAIIWSQIGLGTFEKASWRPWLRPDLISAPELWPVPVSCNCTYFWNVWNSTKIVDLTRNALKCLNDLNNPTRGCSKIWLVLYGTG